MPKSRTDQLAERLHAAGLRKRVAQTLAGAQKQVVKRGKPPSAAQRTIDELRSVVSEVEGRVTGRGSAAKKTSSSSAKKAARKASSAPKKSAAASKRSAAAKKGAETRKKNAAKGKSRAKARS